MARIEQRGREAGLRAVDVSTIALIIGLLGISLAALLTTPDSRIVDRAERWLRGVVEQVTPAGILGAWTDTP